MKMKLGIAALTLLLAACAAGGPTSPSIDAASAAAETRTAPLDTSVSARDKLQPVHAKPPADKAANANGRKRPQANAGPAPSAGDNSHAPTGSAVAAGSTVSVGPAVSGYTVTISGGFTTDPRDSGRPVKLIAAALGVTDEVFREAFSGVTPARDGNGPTGEEARANKAALLKALAPYGIANERLDEVSNYYRYNGSKGEMWNHMLATAVPIVANGKVTGITIASAGAGYTASPTVTVTGPDGSRTTAVAELRYTQSFATNGSIASIKLP